MGSVRQVVAQQGTSFTRIPTKTPGDSGCQQDIPISLTRMVGICRWREDGVAPRLGCGGAPGRCPAFCGGRRPPDGHVDGAAQAPGFSSGSRVYLSRCTGMDRGRRCRFTWSPDDHRHPDVVADHDAPVAPPRQHQHAGALLTCRDAAALPAQSRRKPAAAPGGPIPPRPDVVPVFRIVLPRPAVSSHILAGAGEPLDHTRLASLNRRMVSMASAIAGVRTAQEDHSSRGIFGTPPTRPAICTSDRAVPAPNRRPAPTPGPEGDAPLENTGGDQDIDFPAAKAATFRRHGSPHAPPPRRTCRRGTRSLRSPRGARKPSCPGPAGRRVHGIGPRPHSIRYVRQPYRRYKDQERRPCPGSPGRAVQRPEPSASSREAPRAPRRPGPR